jgi:hypothetical protein
MPRFLRFFFMHFANLIPIIVYFTKLGAAPYAPESVLPALTAALVVHAVYMAIAWAVGELKQLDVGLLAFYAVGLVGGMVAPGTILPLYQVYSPALLFLALGVTALLPLLLGRTPFTDYYARRQVPAWQLKLPETDRVSRFMAGYWVLLFLVSAALCAIAPHDPNFTFVYPNLIVVVLGIVLGRWLPLLYFRIFPPGLPRTAEALIMGMPFVFDPRAAADATASIQFNVSGADPGEYNVRILRGRCESFTGHAPAPDVTVHTPDTVWVRIAHGELDGTQALLEGQYRAEGDVAVLASLMTWFPRRG